MVFLKEHGMFQLKYNCCVDIGEECGKSNPKTAGFVGGKNSKIRRWPWTVSRLFKKYCSTPLSQFVSNYIW